MNAAWISALAGLVGALIGAGSANLGTWLSDRRKERIDMLARERRQQALLAAATVASATIAQRLIDYLQSGGLQSALEPLSTSRKFAEKLIEKASSEDAVSLSAVMELGIRLDTVLAAIEKRGTAPRSDMREFAGRMTTYINELIGTLDRIQAASGAKSTAIDTKKVAEAAQVYVTE